MRWTPSARSPGPALQLPAGAISSLPSWPFLSDRIVVVEFKIVPGQFHVVSLQDISCIDVITILLLQLDFNKAHDPWPLLREAEVVTGAPNYMGRHI